MLCLKFKRNHTITIATPQGIITITRRVPKNGGGVVLAIDAPRHFSISRAEAPPIPKETER